VLINTIYELYKRILHHLDIILHLGHCHKYYLKKKKGRGEGLQKKDIGALHELKELLHRRQRAHFGGALY